MTRRRILIVCPEPIGAIRTGVGIRLYEMAAILAAGHRVTLAAPSVELPETRSFETISFTSRKLSNLLHGSDVVISQGHITNEIIAAGFDGPLVVDLYDPFIIENLAYAKTLGPAVFDHDRKTLSRQLERGDFFLAASEYQRAFYLGMLTLLGRVNPASHDADGSLANLVAVVPFGISEPGLTGAPERFRDSIGLSDEPLVFFGGIYDWYDPLTAVRAIPSLLEKIPNVRLLFVENPRPDTTPQALFAKTCDEAQRLGVASAIVTVPWIPYEDRGSAMAAATIGLVTHHPCLETDLSYRTRVLDFLFAGLPVVASRGGAASDLIARARAGILVPPEDPEAVARAMTELLADRERAASMGASGQGYVKRHHPWDVVLAPLLTWLETPRRDPHRPTDEESSGSIGSRLPFWRKRR